MESLLQNTDRYLKTRFKDSLGVVITGITAVELKLMNSNSYATVQKWHYPTETGWLTMTVEDDYYVADLTRVITDLLNTGLYSLEIAYYKSGRRVAGQVDYKQVVRKAQ